MMPQQLTNKQQYNKALPRASQQPTIKKAPAMVPSIKPEQQAAPALRTKAAPVVINLISTTSSLALDGDSFIGKLAGGDAAMQRQQAHPMRAAQPAPVNGSMGPPRARTTAAAAEPAEAPAEQAATTRKPRPFHWDTASYDTGDSRFGMLGTAAEWAAHGGVASAGQGCDGVKAVLLEHSDGEQTDDGNRERLQRMLMSIK